MGHIEKNKCPRITALDFEKRRAQKEIVKAFLADPEGLNDSSLAFSETGGSEDGGVALNFGSISKASTSVAPPHLSEKMEWPQLQSQAFKDPNQDDLLTGVSSLTVAEPSMAWGTASSSKLFPDAPQTPADPDWSAPPADDWKNALEERDSNTELYHPKSKGWNPEMFRNAATGKYQCPWNLCG